MNVSLFLSAKYYNSCLATTLLGMNCPSRNDDTLEHEDWNQNPSALAADVTTREDLNGIVNRRTNQDSAVEAEDTRSEAQGDGAADYSRLPEVPENAPRKDSDGRISYLDAGSPSRQRRRLARPSQILESFPVLNIANTRSTVQSNAVSSSSHDTSSSGSLSRAVRITGQILKKFLGFVGPGFLVAVAYIDPGNYSTDVSAGVATQFKLLFIVLMSNVFAIILQSLAIRLGTVTGMHLAEHCRAHLPKWLNLFLYILGEAAIIATDIAEVG